MLTINRFSDVPVYEQIVNAIERDVLLGTIKENDKLPSVRELAALLDVNPNTIQKSYTELHARGIIITVASSGAFIAKGAAETIRVRKQALLEKIRELSYELYYAGYNSEVVVSEVRAAFSSPQSIDDNIEEFELPIRSQKERNAVKAKSKPAVKSTPRAETKTKEAESKKPTNPQRRKMGIELL